MASYELNTVAAEDVRRLYRHGIERFGLAQADSYFDGLFERFDQLAEQPYLYPAVDGIRAGYRRSVYGVHSIYYRVLDGQVEIMRVLGREDPSVLLG
jgi:toxin ParE1/3/4